LHELPQSGEGDGAFEVDVEFYFGQGVEPGMHVIPRDGLFCLLYHIDKKERTQYSMNNLGMYCEQSRFFDESITALVRVVPHSLDMHDGHVGAETCQRIAGYDAQGRGK
jgi:hypothetical protein